MKWHKFKAKDLGFLQLIEKSALESGRYFVSRFSGRVKTVDVEMFGDSSDVDFVDFMRHTFAKED
jgi:hypothetical protein